MAKHGKKYTDIAKKAPPEAVSLDEAIAFCHERGLDFYSVNSNDPPEAMFPRHSAKVIADVYIDDRNLGGLPDWNTIYEMIGLKRAERREKRRRHSRWPWKK